MSLGIDINNEDYKQGAAKRFSYRARLIELRTMQLVPISGGGFISLLSVGGVTFGCAVISLEQVWSLSNEQWNEVIKATRLRIRDLRKQYKSYL